MEDKLKEKAIKEAWGQHYDFVSKNLNKDGSFWVYRYQEDLYNWCLKNTKVILAVKDCTCFIPKAIIGVENNNGWLRIESKNDLPKEDWYYHVQYHDGRYTVHRFNPESQFDISFFTEEFSHYQPVIKPNKAIY